MLWLESAFHTYERAVLREGLKSMVSRTELKTRFCTCIPLVMDENNLIENDLNILN